MTQPRDENGRFMKPETDVESTIVDADVVEFPVGTSLVVRDTPQGVDLVPERPALPDMLIEEALTKLDPDQMASVVSVIERLYPEARQPTGKLRHFEWPECPSYQQLVNAG